MVYFQLSVNLSPLFIELSTNCTLRDPGKKPIEKGTFFIQ